MKKTIITSTITLFCLGQLFAGISYAESTIAEPTTIPIATMTPNPTSELIATPAPSATPTPSASPKVDNQLQEILKKMDKYSKLQEQLKEKIAEIGEPKTRSEHKKIIKLKKDLARVEHQLTLLQIMLENWKSKQAFKNAKQTTAKQNTPRSNP